MSEQLSDTEVVRLSFNEQHTLGEIELLPCAPLGEGGQAVVFLGKYPEDKFCAVKIHKSAGENAPPEKRKASEAFRREAMILGELNHPNIVDIYDSGVHLHKVSIQSRDGKQFEHTTAYDYIVMEYAQHGSVADRIERLGPGRILPVTESATILVQAGAGLECAHSKDVVHGDFKPGNVLLAETENGLTPKVADFGIARGGGEMIETEVGTALHAFSARYASARQIEEGGARVIDDIYALGVTAYYLFTGEHPIKPRHPHDADAHRSTIVRPMRPLLMEGREIVEELAEPIGAIFQNGRSDFTFPYPTMAAFQAAVREGLARAESRAAKATTFIILNGEQTTWPLAPDELAHAQLEVEAAPVAAANREAGMPQAEVVNMPNDTEKPQTGFARRRFLRLGAGVLGVAVAAVVADVWVDPFSGENSAEQERLKQERKAIADLAYGAVDYVSGNGYEKDLPAILRELIPYDPARIEPFLEKIAVDLSSPEAATLASYLVPYDPAAANRFMQGAVNAKNYGDAIRVAIRLAAFTQTPAGKDGNWQAEVQKVRDAFAQSNLSTEERQNADQILNAALNPRDPSALNVLKYHNDNDINWVVEILGAAMAPHNPDGVAEVFSQRIEKTNRTYEDTTDYDLRVKKYNLINSLGRSLAPYAPDAVAKGISQLKSDGGWQYSTQPTDAQMRLAVAVAPYKPEAAITYIKAGNENPDEWQTHRWNTTTLIALSAVNPDFVRIVRPHITDVTLYSKWIDFDLNPTDPVAQKNALDALKTIQGVYVSDIKYALEALLLSRQPK